MKKYKLYFKKGTSVYEQLGGQEVIIDEGHLDVLADGGTLPIIKESDKKIVDISYSDLSMTLSVKN